MTLSRRAFLGRSLAFPAMAAFSVPAGSQSADYRALVNVYLGGGNDGVNTLVPLDAGQFAHYSRARGNLTLPRGSDPSSCLAELPGVGYGLHPSLRPLLDAWREGALAFVHNVGPLVRPTTQAELVADLNAGDLRRVPQLLYSHSDQTLLWQNGAAVVGRNVGWGGLAADQFRGGPPVVSIAGNTRFGAGVNGGALVLAPNGQFELPGALASGPDRQLAEVLARNVSGNALVGLYAQKQLAAFDLSSRLSPIAALAPGAGSLPSEIGAAFADMGNSALSRQLFQVAKLIHARSVLGGQRHIFFVALNGFDTHGGQISLVPHQGVHANLLAELSSSLLRFRRAMISLGLDAQVTSFSTSEFGRTVAANSALGTDHGWGNLQFVLGGSVLGGRLHGDAPSLEIGGPNEAGPRGGGVGRWLPTSSVEQYATPLLRWLDPALDLQPLFPNLRNFALDKLQFMRT